MGTKSSLKISAVAMILSLGDLAFAQGLRCEDVWPPQFSISDAKAAAVEHFKLDLDPSQKIGFEKRNSQEYDVAYLKQQMEAIGPGNVYYKKYEAMLAELTQDPSLQIFRVSLTTGRGETRTQDFLTVRIRVVDGKVKTTVHGINDAPERSSSFTLMDAKKAAEEFFRRDGAVAPGERVGFEKRNSQEYDAQYLKEKMELVGPGNIYYRKAEDMLAELTQDPSLRIFHISLTTGRGETRTQDYFIVKLRIVDGATTTEILHNP